MSQHYGESPSFSIFDVMRGMGRRKLLMLTSLALGALIGFGIVTTIKPKYQAEARVLVDNFSTPYDSANVANNEQRDREINERTVASQVAVLQSEDLAQRVISQLRLSEQAEFDPMKSGLGLVKQVLIQGGFSDDPRNMTLEQRAYDQLSGAVTVYPVPESNVIGIKYDSGNGETAAAVANALAETYVLSTRESRSGDNDRVRNWLSTQIDGLRTKVAESDAAVEKYRADAGLLKGQNTGTLGAQEISELNSQITLAEAAKSEAEAKAAEIRTMLETQGTVEASSEVLSSATIQRLQEQQATAQSRLTELSATYLPNHPRMVAAQKDVNDIERRMRREALKIVDGLQGQAKIAAARANSLRKSLEGLKGRESNSLQDEVRLNELERDAKANRDQLEVMLARYADSNTRQNLDLQPGFARIIQTASVPASPFFPKPGPIMLLMTLAGLTFGLGLAFLLEIMAQATRMNEAALGGSQPQARVRHPAREAMEHQADIPSFEVPPSREAQSGFVARAAQPANPAAMSALSIVSSVPPARTLQEAKALVAGLSAGGALQQNLGQLSLHVQSLCSKGSHKAIAMASVGGAGEGPALALALSRSLAGAGVKTILVDLNPHHSMLPDLIALPAAPGLTELLSGFADFSRAIQRDTASELQFLRHGSFELAAGAQLATRMEAITKTLLGIYDVVVLHMGEASPSLLTLAKGSSMVLISAPLFRKQDAQAAASTLKTRGYDNVHLVQVEDAQQVAA